MKIRRPDLLFFFLLLVLLSYTPHLLGRAQLEELAKIQYYQGDLYQAQRLYQTLVDSYPDPSLYFDLACIYSELGEGEKALAILQDLISMEAEEPRWLRELGILSHHLGYFQAALSPLESSLTADPHREAYLYLGLSWKALGDYSKAVWNLQQALDLDPHYALGHYRLAVLYDYLTQVPRAIHHYLLALRYDPSMTDIHTLLGERYLELGDYESAYQRFLQAVMVNPNPLNQARLDEMQERFPHFLEERARERPKSITSISWEQIEPSPDPAGVPQVRVMLLQKVRELDFMMGGDFQIMAYPQGRILGVGAGQKTWTVRPEEGGFLLLHDTAEYFFSQSLYLTPVDDRDPFLLFHVLYGYGYFWAGTEDRRYRGDLELKVLDGHLTVINHLNLEEYLYSVVPSEMPALWPMEGLKAQAVAARTYTMRRLGEGDYDLCATVLSAVYRGLAAEHQRSTQAVNATRGEILTWQGEIIDAVYSSNVGGHTESSASIWGGERPYLQPVSTDKEPQASYLSPGELREWLMEDWDSFSNQPPYTSPNQYRWVRRFDAAALEAQYPELGDLVDIQIRSRGEGGSVLVLALVGKENERIFQGDAIRGAFNNLRSSRFFVERIYDGGGIQEFLFYGGGFGHSVGMGQSEAAAMAHSGYDYLEILKFFYQGVEQRIRY